MREKAQHNELKNKISNLPNEPGIYKYFDNEHNILYIGKAKNIKKRVSSYFTKALTDNKTRVLVNQITDVEFIVVNSEADALLLENNLIKENKPKYNILLKDDKTFPYILVTNDYFPKIYATRRLIPGKGDYYGPYSSVGAMNTVLELLKKLFTIRNCDLNLTTNTIAKNKFKKCLEFHLGNCKAPCEALQHNEDYINEIKQAKEILGGDLRKVERYFEDKMKFYAANLDFENAQKIKEKIDRLKKFQSYSLVSNNGLQSEVIATYKRYNKTAFINIINIAFGRIIQSKTIETSSILDETDEEIFAAALTQLLLDLKLKPKEILSNLEITIEGLTKTKIPIRGDKKELLSLSLKNIEYNISTKESEIIKEPAYRRLLEVIQKDLNLKELPTHIECFDNSNFQGSTPVAAMVCFKNGQPYKSEWRHFNIKTVKGPNDFESMEEIVYRRYSRLLEENKPLPNLIIIDGGKGQLSSAIKSLEKLDIYGKIPIISIAKRLEEIYTPNDDLPLLLKKNSETLKFIQRIRDEVHRFGITFHRKKRDKIPPTSKNKKERPSK